MLQMAGSGGVAQAATVVVVNTADSGPGSLRDAIATSAPGDTITFDPGLSGQTITLTSGQLSIAKSLTISGPAGGVTVSGNDSSRVFRIYFGFKVSISRLTVSRGVTPSGSPFPGAGIFNEGDLQLANVSITDNDDTGVANEGILTITDSAISNNEGAGLAEYPVFNRTVKSDLTNVTISYNRFSGILNQGVVETLNNVTISNNTATVGAGIANSDGSIVGRNVHVDDNVATDDGGGIFNGGGLELTDSTVDGNSATGGGGIVNAGGMLLTRVSVTDNHAQGAVAGFAFDGIGGGIFNAYYATLTDVMVANNVAESSDSSSQLNGDGGGIFTTTSISITNSTISGNTAIGKNVPGSLVYGNGGGLFNLGGLVELTNSTISGNSVQLAASGSGTIGSGGGIFNTGGQGYSFSTDAQMDVTNVTVTNNSAQHGGGIFNSNKCCGTAGTTPTLNLKNSIVAKQIAGADCLPQGPITSLGYNLDSDGSCSLAAPGDLPNTDPLLDPLYLNPPGNTETHALQPGSPAIDHIPPHVNGCGSAITKDQRGVTRPQGSGCDIGAFEALPSAVGGVVELVSARPGSWPFGFEDRPPALALGLVAGAVFLAIVGRRYYRRGSLP